MFVIMGKEAGPPAQMVSGKSAGLSIWGLQATQPSHMGVMGLNFSSDQRQTPKG